MSDKDVVITTQMRVPDGSPISNKPNYLVTLNEKNGKTAQAKRFISLDLPNMTQPNFVQMKGFYCDQSEEEIVANHKQIVQSFDKDKMVEVYFSAATISSIRNLIFKAK